MSTLQEVLAVLLGAESEAKRIVGDSKTESAELLRMAQEKFTKERANQIASAREQAKEIMTTAVNAAKAEADQIADLSKEEMKRIQTRFDQNVDTVVTSMVSDIAEKYVKKGE